MLMSDGVSLQSSRKLLKKEMPDLCSNANVSDMLGLASIFLFFFFL